MKNKIKGILIATILAASGSAALADGHYNGQGFPALFPHQLLTENLDQLSI